MEALGVRFERSEGNLIVHGVGKTGLRESSTPLDCGNSGTTMRLISGILAGQSFTSTLIGDESLSKRPMKRIIGPLTEMGAGLESVGGHAPLTINGRNPLKPLHFQLPVASAQLKSCVLLAGLYADGETSVIETVATRNHTELMLRGFGVDVEIKYGGERTRISVSGEAKLTATDIQVPSDVSSAAFFVVAAACIPGSRIEMPGVGLNTSRTGIVEVLRGFGASIESADERVSGGEPIGTLIVTGGERLGARLNQIHGPIVANLIDEVPILAVFGTQTESGIEIRDAGELRVKESDRIAAVAEGLRRMGADVEEFEDGLRVGPSKLKGAVIDTYHDHRIAMAFAIAGLFAEGETEIRGAETAAVSFPEFFHVLSSVSNG
jgi:3-phosphoshikimate 1-carboxyvinyltransferase